MWWYEVIGVVSHADKESEREIVNLKDRHGHCAQGRQDGSNFAAVGNICSTSGRLSARLPPLFLPSLTVRANQWPGLVLVISHSQVPEVARVVARRTQQHKRGRLKLNLLLLLPAHLPCLPCLLYFIRCSGVTSNPAHVEVHSICGDLRLPPSPPSGLSLKSAACIV